MASRTKTKDLRSLDWGRGVVWKKHERKNSAGEIETVETPYVRARVTKDGRRRAVWTKVASPEHAEKVRARLTVKRDAGGSDELLRARKTFADLAKYYREHYAVPARYVDGRKIAGLRDHAHARRYAEMLEARFGSRPLSALTHGEIRRLKLDLLATKTARRGDDGGPRTLSITSAHRVLQTLRHMLNVAVAEGWLQRNPFNAGDPLISPADERKRKRILSREEEARLLASCGERITTYKRKGRELTLHDDGARRPHLRALLVCLLDTAMRSGEALKLRWPDLDIDRRNATVQEFNTKTLTERSAPVTERLARELAALYPLTGARPDRLVFGVTTSFKKSFASACDHAGVKGLRAHDLRRTAATRLVRGGMPIEEVARILGHANIQTTYRYVGVDDDTVARAAAIFDRLNEEAEGAEAVH